MRAADPSRAKIVGMSAHQSTVLKKYRPLDALEREALMLERVASGTSIHECEVWATTQCLVASQRMARLAGFHDHATTSAASGWPVHVRGTGGSLVPQGSGIINVSLAFASTLAAAPTIEDAYAALCQPIVDVLNGFGCPALIGPVAGSFCDGGYNIIVGNRKVAGTAQRWRPLYNEPAHHAVFAHALILVDADLLSAAHAINALNEVCGVASRVKASAHANLQEHLSSKLGHSARDDLAYRLQMRFDEMLAAMHRA